MSVTLPLYDNWIPNVDQITDAAAGLLTTAGEALDAYGFGEDYEARFFSAEDPVPWRSDPQLSVCFNRLHLGLAGQEQFVFASGNQGAIMKAVMEFTLELVNRWPTVSGTQTPLLAGMAERMEATRVLQRDGFVVWSALRALALGGVRTDPPVAPIVQDNILLGPMTPKAPQGALMGYAFKVQIQL